MDIKNNQDILRHLIQEISSKDKNSILVNEFDDDSVKAFKATFENLLATTIPIIPIYIDSYGGEVYSLLAMMDMISSSKRPVATICLGKAMSCGSYLLACGSPGLRFIGPLSTVMIHDVSQFSWGKLEELKADVGEADRLNNLLLEILAEKCGHKNKDYFKKLIAKNKHANLYLSSADAIKHGIVDHIGTPMQSLAEEYVTSLLSKKRPTPKKRRK